MYVQIIALSEAGQLNNLNTQKTIGEKEIIVISNGRFTSDYCNHYII